MGNNLNVSRACAITINRATLVRRRESFKVRHYDESFRKNLRCFENRYNRYRD